MLESIHTAKIQNQGANSATALPVKSPAVSANLDAANRNYRPESKIERGQESKKETQVSQAMLDALQQDLEMMHDVKLQFAMHDATGRTMVKVIDKDTEELIREFPPEKILDLAAKMDEMLGILFDKKV